MDKNLIRSINGTLFFAASCSTLPLKESQLRSLFKNRVPITGILSKEYDCDAECYDRNDECKHKNSVRNTQQFIFIAQYNTL